MGDVAQFELVIRAALSSENTSRQQAEATFKQALAHADSFLGLTMQTIQSSSGRTHALLRPCTTRCLAPSLALVRLREQILRPLRLCRLRRASVRSRDVTSKPQESCGP